MKLGGEALAANPSNPSSLGRSWLSEASVARLPTEYRTWRGGEGLLAAKDQRNAVASGHPRTGSVKSAVTAVTLVTLGALIAACATLFVALGCLHATSLMPAILSWWRVQDLLYAFLIALTNNVDNLGARIAYSIQGTKVSTPVNIWISIITFIISFGAALLGTAVIGSLGAKAASVIAMTLLAGLGSLMILQAGKQTSYLEEPQEQDRKSLWSVLLKPQHADVDASKHIDFKEGTVLGVALSVNNIGGGLSAGIIGVPPFLVGFLSAVLSFVALWAGNYLAEFFVKRGIARKAAVIGGVLLIIIGIKQVF
jgi:putative sporulation protein YtaF